MDEQIGRFPNEPGLVSTTTEGTLLRRSNFARVILRPAAARIGVPDLRVHDLRYAHASLLLATGEPVAVVSKRLGHRSTLTTMRIYAHAIPGSEGSSADAMDAMFATIPTTVRSYRGMDAGYGPTGNVTNIGETQ